MNWEFGFFITSALLGVGLAMDAFSVSLANGLREPEMPVSRSLVIAGTFAVFQTLMPLLGWFCVHSIAEAFQSFQRFIPWIALALLVWIGVKMILEGLHGRDEKGSLKGSALFVQGIATSIDALSVGFTIAEYTLVFALTESLIIGAVGARTVRRDEESFRAVGADRVEDPPRRLGAVEDQKEDREFAHRVSRSCI